MYAIDVEREVPYCYGVLVAPELHLQHAIKAPTHERGVREPRGHWRGETNITHAHTRLFDTLIS